MFTGIIQHTGRFERQETRVFIQSDMDLGDVVAGDSIALNGVCLTALKDASLEFDLGPETLAKTTLGNLEQRTVVHLEKALRMSDRLGGHFVQGHVDGVGEVEYLERLGDSLEIGFKAPEEIIRLCIPKGSIAVNGVSLTINHIREHLFTVCLVPHTLEKTKLGDLQVGENVNLENDMLVKILSQMHFNLSIRTESGSQFNHIAG